MGQILSDATLNRTSLDDSPFSSDENTKLERILRELSEFSDETKIIFKWEKMMEKKTKTAWGRWGLASFAIKTLENWGKHKLMLTYSVYQVELAHDVLKDNSANGKTTPDPLSGVAIMADALLNLSR